MGVISAFFFEGVLEMCLGCRFRELEWMEVVLVVGEREMEKSKVGSELECLVRCFRIYFL